jgi:hypothetical protein
MRADVLSTVKIEIVKHYRAPSSPGARRAVMINIPWKFKSAAYSVIDRLHLRRFAALASKYVTRRMVVDPGRLPEHFHTHAENIKSLTAPRLLEFGAGKHLAQNIFLSQFAPSQVVIDLDRLLDCRLADEAARVVSRLQGIPYHPIRATEDLERYGIRYLAPQDVASTGLPDDCFDCCVSTDTLEHIPRGSLLRIFTELRRLIRAGGLISAVIGYDDHYAHTDRSIGPLHFLGYGDAEYARHNHRSQYVNRLRHHDFERMFTELGYSIVRSEPSHFAEPPPFVAPQFDAGLKTTFATKGVFLLENGKSPPARTLVGNGQPGGIVSRLEGAS